MPQTFQLPKLSGQIRWSALKSGRMRSYEVEFGQALTIRVGSQRELGVAAAGVRSSSGHMHTAADQDCSVGAFQIVPRNYVSEARYTSSPVKNLIRMCAAQ